MDDSESQILKLVLRRMRRCRVCHHAHDADEVQIVSRSPEMWMLVVECPDCHTRNFVAAVLNEGDPEKAEIALRQLSDMHQAAEESRAEGETIVDARPVGASDVLDMHEFLDQFNGDFRSLFRAAPGS